MRLSTEVLHTSHHRLFVLDRHLFDFTQLDITNKGDVKSLVTSFRPDIIVNAAAMTNVDVCETQRELAWKVNVVGVENLVEVARRLNSLLIQISTDYVFDGKNGPYKETDRANPVNYYGKTKLAGENVILAGGISSAILRTIVVYGTGINVKNNFALWVISSLREGKKYTLCRRPDRQSHTRERPCGKHSQSDRAGSVQDCTTSVVRML